MNSLLLVLPSSTYRTNAFMEAAARLDVTVLVASDHRQAMAALVPDTTLALNFRKPEQIREKIASYFEKNPFLTAIGVDDQSAHVAAQINETLGLPGIPVEATAAARNKYLMRQKLAAADVNVPNFDLHSLEKPQPDKPVYPCVLKPTFLSASRGVTRANKPGEFSQAFSALRELIRTPEISARAHDGEAASILVEDYVPGMEVALEGILTDGDFKSLAIFDKPDPLEGPHFVETIYVTPSRLPAYVQRELIHETHKAALALGIDNGPVHAELRVNEQGAWIIEIAARSIGGLCSRVLRFSEKLVLEDLILRQAIGVDISEVQRERQAAAVMMVPIPSAGRLKRVGGVDEASAVEGVEDVIISIPNGQEVLPMPFGGRYLGFIFARADMPEEAEDSIRRAHACLKIEIDDGTA
ncbi:MAG: ATP-grasp domain-containing protein [Calditrichia bacterium]